MAIKLSTGWWDIHTTPFAGLTCYRNTIVIDSGEPISTKEYMDTLVHETIHASRPDLSEAAVVKLAGDVTTMLWAAGYRLNKKRRRKPPVRR